MTNIHKSKILKETNYEEYTECLLVLRIMRLLKSQEPIVSRITSDMLTDEVILEPYIKIDEIVNDEEKF